MNKIIFFSLFLFLIQPSFAQKDGLYQKQYDNGQLKISGQYKNKKRIGEWKSYYKTGELSSIYSYNGGKKNKISKSFYKNGSLKSETKKIDDLFVSQGYFKNGKLLYERSPNDGYYKEYLENGSLKIESNYLDNQLSGIWKRFFKTGELEWQVSYKEGYKDDHYKCFYKNGNIKIEGSFKKNIKEGKEKRYFENGKLAIEGTNTNGQFNKKWFIYSENGHEIQELKYKKGLLITTKNSVNITSIKVPDGHFENVPIFPGCENELNFRAQKKCLSNGISKIIHTNFNTEMASNLNLIGRQKIYLTFIINKEGYVADIKAKTSHRTLKMETIRVAQLLPKMIPGKVRGETVEVPYSMPIIFQVQK